MDFKIQSGQREFKHCLDYKALTKTISLHTKQRVYSDQGGVDSSLPQNKGKPRTAG